MVRLAQVGFLWVLMDGGVYVVRNDQFSLDYKGTWLLHKAVCGLALSDRISHRSQRLESSPSSPSSSSSSSSSSF